MLTKSNYHIAMEKTAIISRLESVFAELTQFLEHVPDDQFGTPLAEGKWSIGQHAMHLLLSTTPITRAVQLPPSALVEKFGTRGEHQERDEAQLVKDYLSVLSTGVKAPPKFSPETVTAAQKPELIAGLRQEATQLTAAVAQWEESDLSNGVIPHPAMGKMTVREMLMFVVYHTEHHLGGMRD